MRIFIVGATGVIGSRVVPRLIALGHEVTALSRSEANRAALEGWGARPSAELALAGHDAVINLATHIPPSSRALMPGAWRATNALRRTLPPRIARAAAEAGVRRYVQESFAPAVPDRGGEWIDETVPLATGRYNSGLDDAEAAVRGFGGDGVVLRFGFFYGPDSDFFRDIVKMVRKGWSPTMGRPDGYQSSVSHDDAAEAVIAALALPRGTYNVVDDEPLTKRDLVDSLADRLGVSHPRFLPSWLPLLFGSLGRTLARSQRISNRKLREASSWRPKYPSVREGWEAVLTTEEKSLAI
jgi:nucleoside-diphosphate-sugar epimerase